MKIPKTFRLHFIVFLWGFTAILGKLIDASAQVLVFYRMLFASFFIFLFIKFIKKDSIKVKRSTLLKLVGIGALIGFHWLCFFYSIKVSNVSIALSTLSFSTLFAAFVEPIVYKRKFDWSEMIIGVVVLVCMSFIFNAELKYKLGIFFGILCALFGTFFSIFNGKVQGETSSINMIFYEVFGGWCILAIFYCFTGDIFHMTEFSTRDFWLILILAGVFTAYPMYESVDLMKYISPFTLILTVNLEPIYGIILAYFIFEDSERMSTVFYVSSLVMISAIIFNGIIKSRKKKRENNTIFEK